MTPVVSTTPDKRSNAARFAAAESGEERRPSSLNRDGNLGVRRPLFAGINGAADKNGKLESFNNSNWLQLEITGNVTNLSPEIWKFTQLTHLYLNDNSLAILTPEISRLTKLEVLDVSHNKLQALPIEIGDIVTLKELLLSNNLLRHLPYELGRLFQLHTLTLTGNPLPSDLLNIFETQGTQKLIQFYQDHIVRLIPPLEARTWQTFRDQDSSRTTGLMVCMCYNILSDKYANTKTYAYCPAWALEWETRRQRIMEEIRAWLADIIALQEVETEPYNTFFLPELHNHGYDGIFQPKSRARTMADVDAKHVDGCAIFYKKNRLRLVREKVVEFNQIAIQSYEVPDMLNRVMPRDNIALFALFEPREDFLEPDMLLHYAPSKLQRHKVLVVNAHIHWDPTYSDVKVVQTIMLVHELRQYIVELYREGVTRDMYAHLQPLPGRGELTTEQIVQAMPIILCGDFNSVADSAVVQYLLTGRVHTGHEDFRATGYEPALAKMSTSARDSEVTHDLRFANAYTNSSASAANEPLMPFTNYTYTFRDIIDYVFYSTSEQQYAPLRVLGVLGGPNPRWFDTWKVPGCPQPSIPSDHFPLVVEFELVLHGSAVVSSQSQSTSSSNSQPQSSIDGAAPRRGPSAVGYGGNGSAFAYAGGSGMLSTNAHHSGYHHPPSHYRPGSSRTYK